MAWRKLHLAVDANTGEIVASDLTGRRTHDCTRVPVLLEQLNGRVASVSADGAYDTEGVYEVAHAHGEGRTVKVLIPPGRDAQLSPRPSAALMERNRNIRFEPCNNATRTLRSTISTFVATENIENRWKILGVDDFDFGIDGKYWESTISTLESTRNFGHR